MCCQGLNYIHLISAYTEKQVDIMRSVIERYEKECMKNYEGIHMRHSLDKIFQKAAIHTKVSIRMFIPMRHNLNKIFQKTAVHTKVSIKMFIFHCRAGA